ncbi:hypothetical protein AgCh_003416 [Apium graveolens]
MFPSQVVKGEMMAYSDVSGCYRFWNASCIVWKSIKELLEKKMEKMKILEEYHPLFIFVAALQTEKDHIEGFAPELRSRELLWEEGHIAFATKEEADVEVLEILEIYRRIYEKYLAVPVVKGKKSEMEKFAGGLYTTSVEAFIPETDKGIQGATSHCLGQNFANVFNIKFQDENGKNCLIRVMVMVHEDDKGLVLPHKVAFIQVIEVPVPYKEAETQKILDTCSNTVKTLPEVEAIYGVVGNPCLRQPQSYYRSKWMASKFKELEETRYNVHMRLQDVLHLCGFYSAMGTALRAFQVDFP